VEEANSAVAEIRVEHKEDLVVPFRIPWDLTADCGHNRHCLASASFSRPSAGSSVCDINDYGRHFYL